MLSVKKYEGDSLTLQFQVQDKNGVNKDVTGATISAIAESGTSTVNASSVSFVNALTGLIQVSFNAGALGIGPWDVYTRIVLDGETDTRQDKYLVMDSPF